MSENAVSSRYAPKPREASGYGREIIASRALLRGLASSQQAAAPEQAQLQGTEVRILVPSTSQDWWYGGWFRAPRALLHQSRRALRKYQSAFADNGKKYVGEFPFTYRTTRTAATGLPAYLRGWLKTVPNDASDVKQKAEDWLNDPLVAQSFLGESGWHKFFPDPPDIYPNPKASYTQSDRDTYRHFDVHYQQQYQDWPVFGGQLTVHLTKRDPRISGSSTYMPIPPDKAFKLTLSCDEARRRARQAMNHYADGGVSTVPVERTGCLSLLLTMIRTLLGQPVRAKVSKPVLTDWKTEINFYAGSPLVVFPFAGDYRLAYHMMATSETVPGAWSVFVDAETGDVLGRPSTLACFAKYYQTSQDAFNNQPAVAELSGNPCEDFMDISICTDSGNTRPPNWDPSYPSSSDFRTTTDSRVYDFEAISLAINARDCLQYMQGVLPGDTNQLTLTAPILNALVNASLDACFEPCSHTIFFKHDGTDKVHNAVFDPEVVYHEVAHGLMWYLNSDPFEHSISIAPFAAALKEGYAIYFARSLGAQNSGQDGKTKTYWAIAAYQEDDWKDEWAFFRSREIPGEDLLTCVNLYPRVRADSPGMYDVGMIWARALWDLRNVLGQATADSLALDASLRVHGWVTGFEQVADALLDTASRMPMTLNGALEPLLAARGILSIQGIRAMVAIKDTILVGTDAGLRRLTNGGTTWSSVDEQIEADGDTDILSDIVALTANGDTFYVATETNIYQCKKGEVVWTPFGEWNDESRPLALDSKYGNLCLATGEGVWTASVEAPTWTQMEMVESNRFLPLDVALGLKPNFNANPPILVPTVFVAGFSALWEQALQGDNGWIWHKVSNESTDQILCVAVNDTEVHVGTGNDGIWYWNFSESTATKQQIATLQQLENRAVLCMDVKAEPLIAGTTNGVYISERNGANWKWVPIPGLPENAAVLTIWRTDNGLLAGTALHGLWRQTNAGWEVVPNIQAIADVNVDSIPLSPSIQFTVAADEAHTFQMCPFTLTEEKQIRVEAPTSLDVELWSLSLDAHPIELVQQENNWYITDIAHPGYYAIVVRSSVADSVQITVTVG